MPARAEPKGFAKALAASAVLHAVTAALVTAVWLLSQRPAPPGGPLLDTRAETEVTIDLSFREVIFSPPAADPPPRPAEPPPQPGRRPEVVAIPPVLPTELLAVIRRPDAPPAAVVEVPFSPPPLNPLTAAGHTEPAAAGVPAVTPSPAERPRPPAPLHGTLAPRQAIVYVLDASGSMGRERKFALAREALLATLRNQPPTVRFQVVVYSATARAILPVPDGGCVPGTADNLREAERALAAVEPAGRSSHLDGLKAALACRPDLVVFLTDADDLPAPAFRAFLAAADRPTTLYLGRVAEGRAVAPIEFR